MFSYIVGPLDLLYIFLPLLGVLILWLILRAEAKARRQTLAEYLGHVANNAQRLLRGLWRKMSGNST